MVDRHWLYSIRCLASFSFSQVLAKSVMYLLGLRGCCEACSQACGVQPYTGMLPCSTACSVKLVMT